MDRRLILPFALGLGCAKGSLEGPVTFGVPHTATSSDPSDTGDDDGDDDGEQTGTTGNNSGSEVSSADGEESSTGSPVSGPEESSDDAASVDASAEGESSSSDPSAASASMSTDDSASASASNDDGVMPPPEAGPWEDCQAATCEVGTDCITVNGVAGEPYCSPQCVTDLDCPFPDSGDASPYCLLVGEGAVDPTNCALVCEVDGLDYGTCPDGMSCTSVPGQDPSISLCMW